MKKRMVSIFLAVIMLLTLLPTVAFAGEPAQFDPCNGKEASGSSAAPEWGDYVFLGWYTARTGGEKVTSGFADDMTYYAHWQVSKTNRNLVLTEGLTVDGEGMKVNGAAFDGAAYGLSFTEAKTDDPATLTMTNAVIDTDVGVDIDSGHIYAALYSQVELTIALNGDNVARKGDGTESCICGIYAGAPLSVTGDTLTVTAGDAGGESYGIRASGGFFNNEGTLTAMAGNVAGESGQSYGIKAPSGFKNEGTLTAIGGDAAEMGGQSAGIQSDELTNSGTLTAAAGNAGGQSWGICLDGGALKNEGTLTATGGTAGAASFGIYVPGNMENSGTLTATAGAAGGVSFGIYAAGAITANDGAVFSYGNIQSTSGITAESAFVSGYDMEEGAVVFESGLTTSLTQKTASEPIIIAFVPVFAPCNGGTMLVGTKPEGTWIAPEVEWGDYVFDGWYTARTGGNAVTENFETGTIYYAHWWTNGDKDTLVLTEGLIVTADGLFVGVDEDDMTPLPAPSDYGLSFTEAEDDDHPAILTMTNAVIDTDVGVDINSDYMYAALNAQVDITIDLQGENVVCKGKGSEGKNVYGIFTDYALSLTGDTLTVTAGDAVGEFVTSDGIHVGDLTIGETVTLTAMAGDARGEDGASVGIETCNSNLENKGTLTATAGAAGAMSCGVKITGTLLENKGTLSATAGAAGNSSIGVTVTGNLKNSDTLTATAGDAMGGTDFSCGIKTTGNLENEGTLTATAGDATGQIMAQSAGIHVEGGFLKNGGTLTATAGNAESETEQSFANYESCGIYANNVQIDSGTLTATAGTAKAKIYGILAGTSVNVIDGAVVSYGEINGGYSGITADSPTVTGANETFVSGTTTLSLTQKVVDEPIIIAFVPVFDPCNGEPLMAGAGKTAAPAVAPTREGYTFAGWYTAAVGGEKIESDFKIGTIYYAHWTKACISKAITLLAIAVATAITVRSLNHAAKLVLGAPMALALAPQVLRTLNRIVFWHRFF